MSFSIVSNENDTAEVIHRSPIPLTELCVFTVVNCYLFIGSRQQLLKANPCHIHGGSTDIQPVSSLRNLGSWFNAYLTYLIMSVQVSKSCRAAFYWLHNIKRISQFLPRDKLQMVIHAFVISRIDYCSSLLFGLPNYELAKLQRVQNAAARLLSSTRKYDHITPVLHWLHCIGYLLDTGFIFNSTFNHEGVTWNGPTLF